MRKLSSVLRASTGAAIALWCSGCLWIFNRVDVTSLPVDADTLSTASAVKVHLRDGHTVFYRAGLRISHDTLRGIGVSYDRRLTDSAMVTSVPRTSVAAMESFDGSVNVAKTLIVSGVTTGALVATLVAVWSNASLGPMNLFPGGLPVGP